MYMTFNRTKCVSYVRSPHNFFGEVFVPTWFSARIAYPYPLCSATVGAPFGAALQMKSDSSCPINEWLIITNYMAILTWLFHFRFAEWIILVKRIQWWGWSYEEVVAEWSQCGNARQLYVVRSREVRIRLIELCAHLTSMQSLQCESLCMARHALC